MEIFFISITAFSVSILTFFSGFGLGTLLTPVFMLFFPPAEAIALTGVVHFCNNLFKLGLTGKHASRDVVIRFGIPAVLAALAGSWLLLQITGLPAWYSYTIGERIFEITPVKLIVSFLLIVFALMDLIPYFGTLQFDKTKLPLGGLLSGFFGGLSGNQGALRSAFLIRAGLSKEAFIGTAVVVSTLVDFTRLGIYFTRWNEFNLLDHIILVLFATLSAISGAFIGNKLLKKITLKALQTTVAVLLILTSLALGSGLI